MGVHKDQRAATESQRQKNLHLANSDNGTLNISKVLGVKTGTRPSLGIVSSLYCMLRWAKVSA
jgi:hypothetical protein